MHSEYIFVVMNLTNKFDYVAGILFIANVWNELFTKLSKTNIMSGEMLRKYERKINIKKYYMRYSFLIN